MKIDNYIEALLYDHECIIVPGLGGFIVNERHATIDRISHHFHPPFNKILFNQHIRFNDGLLINFISRKEKLSYETVRKQIDELVQHYFDQLEKGDKVKFENIGVIALDSNKNIIFDQDTTVNFNAESFGLGSFVSQPINRSFETEKVKGIIQAQPLAPMREDRKQKREIADELKPIHERKSKPKAVHFRTFLSIIIVLLIVSSSLFFFKTEPARKSIKLLAETITVKKENNHYTPRVERKDNSEKILPNQASFLSLANSEIKSPVAKLETISSPLEIQAEKKYLAGEISVANYFNYRGRNLNLPIDNNEAETGGEEEVNIGLENTDIPSVTPPAKEEVMIIPAQSLKYYIIAGSFYEETNAKTLIDELLKKGFAAQIVGTNKNGMYRVAYMGMENLNEAKQKLYAIREDEKNPEAWILKK